MAASWQDIYSFFPSTQSATAGYTQGGGGDDATDPSGQNAPGPIGTGKWVNGQYQLDDKYKGIIDVLRNPGGGDDPKASTQVNIDWSKLPNQGMTKYGRIDQTMPAADPSTPVEKGQQSTLQNRNAVVNDPNYGWITSQANQKMSSYDKFNAILPYIIFAATSAGFGSLASVPALANVGLTGAKFLGGKVGGGPSGLGQTGGQSTPQPIASSGGATAGPQGATMSPQFMALRNMIMNQH